MNSNSEVTPRPAKIWASGRKEKEVEDEAELVFLRRNANPQHEVITLNREVGDD